MLRPSSRAVLLSIAATLAACDRASDESKPDGSEAKAAEAPKDEAKVDPPGDAKDVDAKADDDAAQPKCKPDAVEALAAALTKAAPASRPLMVASELVKACELPPAFEAFWMLKLSPEGPPADQQQALTQTSLAVLDDVCPKADEARSATKALPESQRMKVWYEQCDFQRFGLMSAEDYLPQRPTSPVPWFAYHWLTQQGVAEDVAKPIGLAILQTDEPRWAKPGQKLATLSHALPPVSEGIVVHLTPRELIASDKALVEVDERGAFDSMVLEGHLVRPLFDHLAEEADRAKQEAAKSGAKWNGRLVLVADDDARFSTLVDLLYTAGRAEFSTFELVALAGGKHGAVAFVPPTVITTPEGSVASTEDVPSVFVLEDGYRVHIKGQQKGAAERADNPLRPTILLAKPGAALADYDRWDYAKLADEVGRLHTLFPDMRTVNVSAEESIPFGALMRAIQTVRGEGCNAGGDCIFAELIVSAKPTPGADSFDPDAGATEAGSVGESPDDLGLIGLGNVGLIGKGPKKPGEYGRGAGFGGRGRPVPKVRQRKASVEGAMDADIVRRIVRSHINEVRDCYELGLAKDAMLSGEVTIDFTIDARGKVSSAEVVEDTLGDKEVSKCMGKALERWKFTRPKDGGSVKVSYPFVLAPG